MQKMICRLIAVTLALVSLAATADELTGYAQQCESDLGFAASDIPPLNCNNGVLFDHESFTPIHDYVGHERLNANVDLVFACRWMSSTNPLVNSLTAVSIELLIHNRQNGATCFFAAKDFTNPPLGTDTVVSTSMVSPAAANASSYWMQPAEIESKTFKFKGADTPNTRLRCVGCHVAGPYIASNHIAGFLSQYGLLNDGHDTFATRYHAVLPPPPTILGIPVGLSSFWFWNSIIQSTNSTTGLAACSTGCHSIGTGSTADTIFDGPTQAGASTATFFEVVPSLKYVDIPGALSVMPPSTETSDYRWINLDTPDNGVESENFENVKNPNAPPPVPSLMKSCVAPGELEAHAVGIPGNFAFNTVAMSQLPDRLRTFNLKEGLVCVNSDQEPGQSCHDYSIRYMCRSNTTGNNGPVTVIWSDWYRMDSPTGDGDHEERSKDQNICGGVAPIAIQAEVAVNGNTIDVMGPNDRLARFSPYGLTCNNADQPDGKCSNYVVRYSSCTSAPFMTVKSLTNVFNAGKQLTLASSNLVKGQAHNNSWNTQQWIIEPVANTEYVRLRNTNAAAYLVVISTAESAIVGTAPLSNSAPGEMWLMEPVSNSTNVRFKNLLSDKYLTMADPKNVTTGEKDYLPVYSQGLNTGWSSQRWIIQ